MNRSVYKIEIDIHEHLVLTHINFILKSTTAPSSSSYAHQMNSIHFKTLRDILNRCSGWKINTHTVRYIANSNPFFFCWSFRISVRKIKMGIQQHLLLTHIYHVYLVLKPHYCPSKIFIWRTNKRHAFFNIKIHIRCQFFVSRGSL
jgi:hypothetical protein